MKNRINEIAQRLENYKKAPVLPDPLLDTLPEQYKQDVTCLLREIERQRNRFEQLKDRFGTPREVGTQRNRTTDNRPPQL